MGIRHWPTVALELIFQLFLRAQLEVHGAQ